MSVRKIIPVFQAIEAADVAALNTAVATAVTTAGALATIVQGTTEVSNVVNVNTSNQKVYTSITYKVFGAE